MAETAKSSSVLVAGGFNNFPGDKYPNMFVFFGVTAPGHANAEIEQAINGEIDRLKNQLIDDETLRAVKTRAKAG